MNSSQKTKPGSSIEPGTIWQLGAHRLAFGDARNPELLGRLVGKEKINLVCSDVPYATSAVESKRNFRPLSKDKVIEGDHLQDDNSYQEFNRAWLQAIIPHLAKKNSCYVFIGCGLKVSQLLIWVKSQAVVGRLDYAPAHELILYSWFGTHTFRHSKDRSVIFYPRPSHSPLHPTTKPIGLVRRLILNSSKIGDTVYDGFLGSGTSLLACEQTKRKCLAVEIDLEYCLTAIRQWDPLTNLTATKV